MALVTPQLQGSYSTFLSRPLSWSKGMKLKHPRVTLKVQMADRCSLLKCNCCLSVGPPHVRGLKRRSLKISAFKGSAQNDESEVRASSSKSGKNSVSFSYVPQGSEGSLRKSPEAQNLPLSYTEANESIAGSPAIHKLFKSWLTMLRTPSPSQAVEEIGGEGPSKKISGTQNETEKKGRGEILKAVLHYFLGLDASITIPLLIFIPWYLSVNAVYGPEVSKELTPLWILGPLIIALYIRLLQWIVALYVLSFKLIKNLPTYFLVAYAYITQGGLKEDIRARFWQPLVDIKNSDFKEFSRRKMKELGNWMMEKYLDYVESIWPYYCRTIRFLKRANLL